MHVKEADRQMWAVTFLVEESAKAVGGERRPT